MAVMPAARENMDTTMDDQLPPHKPRVSRTVRCVNSRFLEATAKLCDWSTLICGKIRRGRSFVDWWTRGRFKSVKQQVGTSINGRWAHNRTTDEYGWPPDRYGEACTAGGTAKNQRIFRIVACAHYCCLEYSAIDNDGVRTKP